MVRARAGLWPVGLCWQVPDPAPRCFNPHDPVWNVRPELLQGALHSLQRKNIPLCLQSDLFSHFFPLLHIPLHSLACRWVLPQLLKPPLVPFSPQQLQPPVPHAAIARHCFGKTSLGFASAPR